MEGEILVALSWRIGFTACLGAPVAGFVARRRGNLGLGVLTASPPPVCGLCFVAL
jgi:hypothetical protein